MAPRVAIIVLNYNGGTGLLETLASLRARTYAPATLWVVDNGSADGSFRAAQASYPEACFLALDENRGFAAGMNAGMRAAFQGGAEYAWLFNYDAVAEPGALEELVEASHGLAPRSLLSPVIMTAEKRVWFAGGRVNAWRMRTEHQRTVSSPLPYQTGYLTGCALLVPRAAFERIGPLDERFFLYYEDADYSIRAREAGIGLFVVPGARVMHRERSQGSPQKAYYLVLSGLLFFAQHRRGLWVPYLALYVRIRKLKNRLDLWFGRTQAGSVARAYADYSRYRQTGSLPHLR